MPVLIFDNDKKLPPVITSKEKQLDAQVKAFKRDKPDEYYNEILKLDLWYRQRHHYLKYFMRKHYRRDEVSYAEAKTILKDFYIPCGNLLLHAVCRCLDHKNKRVVNFSGTRRLLLSGKPSHNIQNVRTLEVVDSYYYVHMKYLPLLSEASLPCHFDVLVRSDMYIGRLSDIIQEKTGLISREWHIYGTPQRSEVSIPVHFTLSQLKVDAGTPDRPGVMILYYSGELEFMNCPLLQCDYYCYYATSSRKLQRKKQQQSADQRPAVSQPEDFAKENREVKMVQEERQRMFHKKKEAIENISTFSDILNVTMERIFTEAEIRH